MDTADGRWEADVESAWRGFRARLGDWLAQTDEDDILVVELAGAEGLRGAAPYVQFVHWTGRRLRVEAVSNVYLDERYALVPGQEQDLLDAGWSPPRRDASGEPVPGDANFHVDLTIREADRAAAVAVAALREVYGVPHPAFLDAGGLEHDEAAPPLPGAAWGGSAGSDGTADVDRDLDRELDRDLDRDLDKEIATFPHDPEHLRTLVDRAVAPLLGAPVVHDADGDIAIRVGQSAVFVQVLGHQAAVDLHSEVVVDVQDPARVPLELAVLNEGYEPAKFYLRGTTVVMTHQVCAWPLAPAQLRAVLARRLEDVDDLARDLAARLDGRRFFDEAREPLPAGPRRDPQDEPPPSLVGLLELLQDGPVATPTVAALFDFDRLELIGQLVAIRRGLQPCDGVPEDVVLAHLRRALRLVADRAAGAEPARRRGRPGSSQLSLLPDAGLVEATGQATLDAGEWEVS